MRIFRSCSPARIGRTGGGGAESGKGPFRTTLPRGPPHAGRLEAAMMSNWAPMPAAGRAASPPAASSQLWERLFAPRPCQFRLKNDPRNLAVQPAILYSLVIVPLVIVICWVLSVSAPGLVANLYVPPV